MKYKWLRKQNIALAMIAFAISISAPLHTEAGFNGLFQQVGVADVLESDLTVEEYMTMAEEAVGALWGYTNIGIAGVKEAEPVYIRKLPDDYAEVEGIMYQDAVCEVGEEEDGWVYVVSGKTEGYARVENLLTGPEARLYAQEIVENYAICTSKSAKVRMIASEKSEVIGKLSKDEEAEVLDVTDEWVKIYQDGMEGYVSVESVTIEERLPVAFSINKLIYGTDISDERAELVEYAKQFIGNPYVWGGTSLTKGADCSGFVMSIFKKFGVNLPHYSGAQAEQGKKIKSSELLPGDLIFYGNETAYINHVAIYIGNDEVIHASSPKNGIMYSKYNYRKPVKCVRLLPE